MKVTNTILRVGVRLAWTKALKAAVCSGRLDVVHEFLSISRKRVLDALKGTARNGYLLVVEAFLPTDVEHEHTDVVRMILKRLWIDHLENGHKRGNWGHEIGNVFNEADQHDHVDISRLTTTEPIAGSSAIDLVKCGDEVILRILLDTVIKPQDETLGCAVDT